MHALTDPLSAIKSFPASDLALKDAYPGRARNTRKSESTSPRSRVYLTAFITYDEAMQRLYSMFPKGAPGVALALMRIALALGFAQSRWLAMAQHPQPWLVVGVLALFAGLCLGLFTPWLCAACAIAEIASWLVEGLSWQQAHVCTVLNAIGLALVGPGAYSLDAHAFGRRRVLYLSSEPPRDERED